MLSEINSINKSYPLSQYCVPQPATLTMLAKHTSTNTGQEYLPAQVRAEAWLQPAHLQPQLLVPQNIVSQALPVAPLLYHSFKLLPSLI